MPDALNLFLGSSFPIEYEIGKQNEEGKFETTSDNLPAMFVSKMEATGVGAGMNLSVFCEHEFLAYQNSELRKAYTSRYGNSIIQDVLDSNNIFKSEEKYKRNIYETDNSATVYRSLGDNDIDIIKNKVCNSFRVANGKPLFFIGLDKKVTFTSISKMASLNEKSKILIRTLCKDSDVTRATKENLKGNYLDTSEYSELTSLDFKMTVGDKNTVFNLKTGVFYTDFYSGLTSTTGYFMKPSSEKLTHYPVDKIFLNLVDASNTTAIVNRPSNNIYYETVNLFEGFESLITIKVTISDCGNLNKLIVAGEFVTFISPYTYSIYNGNYLVSEVEYGMKDSVPFIELILIRPSVDFAWQEKLVEDKEDKSFPYPLAPWVSKSDLYSI